MKENNEFNIDEIISGIFYVEISDEDAFDASYIGQIIKKIKNITLR
jgi:hypothetical protein